MSCCIFFHKILLNISAKFWELSPQVPILFAALREAVTIWYQNPHEASSVEATSRIYEFAKAAGCTSNYGQSRENATLIYQIYEQNLFSIPELKTARRRKSFFKPVPINKEYDANLALVIPGSRHHINFHTGSPCWEERLSYQSPCTPWSYWCLCISVEH